MYRQFSSRNQRNKGFKVKHALQICLLVAVCFWLIYQVKHSYDKRKDFDDNDARNSQHTQTNSEILKLGRKDTHPQVKETSKKNEKPDEEADEDIEVDIKAEEKKNEIKGGGDGKVDEDAHQKSDSKIGHGKVSIDEDKELEGVDEKKKGGNVFTDVDGKIEIESSRDNLDRDRGTKNTHEAREQQYKADDVSSAVTNEGQTFSSETESDNSLNQTITTGNENEGSNTLESIIGQNITDLKVHEGTAGNGTSAMVNPEKGSEVLNSTSQGSIFRNSTITTESSDNLELSNDSAEVDTESRQLLNGTEISILDSSHAQNDTDEGKGSAAGSNIQTVFIEHANNSSSGIVNNRSDYNTADIISAGYMESNLGAFSNSSNDKFALELTAPSNASARVSEITLIEENRDAHQTEKPDLSAEADGNYRGSDSSNTKNAGKTKNGTVDSIVLEDTLPHLELETLPKFRKDASNSEVAADE